MKAIATQALILIVLLATFITLSIPSIINQVKPKVTTTTIPLMTTTIISPSMRTCSIDSDCSPAVCCHAWDVVNKMYAPDCKGVPCTLVCSGDLDCGRGHIDCIQNQCYIVVDKGDTCTSDNDCQGNLVCIRAHNGVNVIKGTVSDPGRCISLRQSTTTTLINISDPFVSPSVPPDVFDRDLRTLPSAEPYTCTECNPITDPQILSNPRVIESKQFLLKYGFSEQYFNDHFKLVYFNVENDFGQVIWLFQVSEYQAIVEDRFVIKFDRNGDILSVQHGIGPPTAFKGTTVHDINNVISKTVAKNLMIDCIQDYQNQRISLNLKGCYYGISYADDAILVLTASSKSEYICPPYGKGPCLAKMVVIDLETGRVVRCDK